MADPIQLVSAARAHKDLSHQISAWRQLQQRLSTNDPEALREFAQLFRADPPAKEPSPTPGIDWMTPCLAIVKEFEGCKLKAYPDPGTGGDPWTIGWGSTGPGIGPGTVWTQQQADERLMTDLRQFHHGVMTTLPMAAEWSGNRQAAITSFAYNVGIGALQESTLRKRLIRGEDPVLVVREELPRWNKGGSGVMPGLTRRRASEVALFAGQTSGQPDKVMLKVPYEYQLDNGSGAGHRECFSSSCAMLARFYGRVRNDDEYNVIRQRYGDTTNSHAQLRALGSLGLRASFHQNGSAKTLETLIRDGCPVPVGWLHRGNVSHPTGGGHWSVVVGFDDKAFYHNDPNGEADLVGGGYVSNSGFAGAGVRYSRKNWLKRWECDGPGTGWYLIVRP